MPYARPTLTDLFARALQDVQAGNLPGVDGLLQRSVLRVLARVLTGLAYEHYGLQDWIALQSTPWTATDENLAGWAALKKVFQKPATPSSYMASFPGVTGRDLPAGTLMSTLDGLAFASSADATVSGANAVVATIVSSGTGTAFNLAVGQQITLSSAIAGITSQGTITGIVSTAADLETEDAFRTRMLAVYAKPPQGGSQSDYEEWAEAVPGVTRAWANPNGNGPGTVVVYVMLDNSEASFGGFPQGGNGSATLELRGVTATGDQLSVANAIFVLQPVTALVSVVTPLAVTLPFTVQNLLPNTAPILAGIQAALVDMLLRVGTPLGFTLYPSDWNEAIGSVPGITHFNVTDPALPQPYTLGQLPVLGLVSTES